MMAWCMSPSGFVQTGTSIFMDGFQNNLAELFSLTHSLVHHFEIVPNSKKLQMTTEMWLLKEFKIQMA